MNDGFIKARILRNVCSLHCSEHQLRGALAARKIYMMPGQTPGRLRMRKGQAAMGAVAAMTALLAATPDRRGQRDERI